MRAWTLGYPPAYERALRMPGNGKAPGGYAFRNREEAEAYAASHAEAGRYAAWEMVLPASFEECTTRNFAVAAQARHLWHRADGDGDPAVEYLRGCGLCEPWRYEVLDCDLLTVVAPFINPDTGEVS